MWVFNGTATLKEKGSVYWYTFARAAINIEQVSGRPTIQHKNKP